MSCMIMVVAIGAVVALALLFALLIAALDNEGAPEPPSASGEPRWTSLI